MVRCGQNIHWKAKIDSSSIQHEKDRCFLGAWLVFCTLYQVLPLTTWLTSPKVVDFESFLLENWHKQYKRKRSSSRSPALPRSRFLPRMPSPHHLLHCCLGRHSRKKISSFSASPTHTKIIELLGKFTDHQAYPSKSNTSNSDGSLKSGDL